MYKMGKVFAIAALFVVASAQASESSTPKEVSYVSQAVTACVTAAGTAATTAKLYAWNFGYDADVAAGLSYKKCAFWRLQGYRAATVATAAYLAYLAYSKVCGEDEASKSSEIYA